MRRVRYQVAMSLDGYIAGPNGESDWIVMDPEIDFAALLAQFDTLLIGRRTYEAMGGGGGGGSMPGITSIVCSRSMKPADHPRITIVADAAQAVRDLRAAPGKDIWLFGGGGLFRSLLDAGLVDAVEVATMPIMLGGGIPLAPPPGNRVALRLTGHRLYAATGTMLLEYAVDPSGAAARTKKTAARRARARQQKS